MNLSYFPLPPFPLPLSYSAENNSLLPDALRRFRVLLNRALLNKRVSTNVKSRLLSTIQKKSSAPKLRPYHNRVPTRRVSTLMKVRLGGIAANCAQRKIAPW